MPEVTVLMSAYNAEKYIKEAIESILRQTFTDFEFLIINDGSIDATGNIIASYKDPRIHIITNEENIGLTRSLNKGLQVAHGDYLARQDADDISLPERLERQVALLTNQQNVGLLGTAWYIIDKDGKDLDIVQVYNSRQAVHFMCHGTTMIRKSLLDQVGGYRDVFVYVQDYDLWLRLAEVCDVRNLSEPLYKLRKHSDSISHTQKKQQELYVAFTIELAKQREKTGGKDMLMTNAIPSLSRLRKDILEVTGMKKRRRLSRNYSTYGKAAFELGEYERALYYVLNAHILYPFNSQAWLVLIAVFAHKGVENRMKLFLNIVQWCLRKIKNLCRKLYSLSRFTVC